MAQEIAFENGRISNFEGLMTLTFDQVILHTVVHHTSTSTYTPNFIEIERAFCRQIDGYADVRTYRHLRPTLLGRLKRVDLKTKARFGHLLQPPTERHGPILNKVNE